MLPESVVLGTAAELPGHNMMKEFRLGDRTVCVANVDGVIVALDKECMGESPFVAHGSSPCRNIAASPGWRWTRRGSDGNDSPQIAIYPVRVENNQLVIQLQMAEHAGPEESSGRDSR
jgi:nitrite reductase/ring-hydroxylating ferredoxin subunit